MSKLQKFTADQWESQVMRTVKPVLVDFRAPWCQPGILKNRMLEKVAVDLGEGVNVGFIDIVQSVDLAVYCRAHDLPALTLLFNGKILITYSGPNRIEKMMTRWMSLAVPMVSWIPIR